MSLRMPAVLRGIGLLAIFRAEGFSWVGGSVGDVLASLAPLLGFPVALALLLILAGVPRALATPLAAIAMFLAPLVASEALARLWGREAEWGRYASSYNWCQWPLAVAALLAVLAASLLVALGLQPAIAGVAAMLAMSLYQLVLHWFLARRGLGVSGLRAVVLTVVADGSSAVILAIFMALSGAADHAANGSAG